jgi:hypothetical protein
LVSTLEIKLLNTPLDNLFNKVASSDVIKRYPSAGVNFNSPLVTLK